jgi:two-component system C4-dicarboxylate transport response regulator DctD
VVTIRMPGLDERREDIPLLFLRLLAELAQGGPRRAGGAARDLLAAIAARDWPGHVRELRNAAERFAPGPRDRRTRGRGRADTLSDRMAAHEKALIAAALAAHSGS